LPPLEEEKRKKPAPRRSRRRERTISAISGREGKRDFPAVTRKKKREKGRVSGSVAKRKEGIRPLTYHRKRRRRRLRKKKSTFRSTIFAKKKTEDRSTDTIGISPPKKKRLKRTSRGGAKVGPSSGREGCPFIEKHVHRDSPPPSKDLPPLEEGEGKNTREGAGQLTSTEGERITTTPIVRGRGKQPETAPHRRKEPSLRLLR